MTSDPCNATPSDSLATLYERMSQGACPVAAVTEGGKLVGLVTPESVNQYMLTAAYQRHTRA